MQTETVGTCLLLTSSLNPAEGKLSPSLQFWCWNHFAKVLLQIYMEH